MPVTWSGEGKHKHWAPTPLRKLGKNEKFLEQVIADSPCLLGLESFRHGFYGPFAAFPSVTLESTQARSIEADIVLLSASGHVVIVEVKLNDNPELHDRSVAAQVFDYATSLTGYDPDDLAALFGGPGEKWKDVVTRHFPDAADPADLAQTLYERCRDGEVRVVIACDIAPDTAPNLVRAMGLQAALGFEVKLVEVVPYTSGDGSEILFVPRDMAQTEVVATTRVVVEYKGAEQPKVSVITPSAESVADSVREAKAGSRRSWDEASFLQDARDRLVGDEYEAVKRVYEFTVANAATVKWGKGAQRGSFNPRFPGVSERSPYTVWSDGQITFNYGWLNDNERTMKVRTAMADRFRNLLQVEPDMKAYPTCPVAEWKHHIDALVVALTETIVTSPLGA
jgi:hypothetical protein